jgi:hypothetical protein
MTSLDIAALQPPRVFVGDAEEIELQQEIGYQLYVAPCGVLWFRQTSISFGSLIHFLLCKRGQFDGPPDMSEDEDFEVREDAARELAELRQWGSVLRSISTIVEIFLEQRPVYLSYLLDHGMEISTNDKTRFCPIFNDFDSLFYRHILKSTFDDGKPWPKLQKLTLRGINLNRFEAEIGKTLSTFTERSLPGTLVQEIPGNYMFLNTCTGTLMNQHGADGLRPQLDSPCTHYYDDFGATVLFV